MSLTVHCPKCSMELEAPDHLAGQSATCPGCRTEFNVDPPIPPPLKPAHGSPVSGSPVSGSPASGSPASESAIDLTGDSSNKSDFFPPSPPPRHDKKTKRSRKKSKSSDRSNTSESESDAEATQGSQSVGEPQFGQRSTKTAIFKGLPPESPAPPESNPTPAPVLSPQDAKEEGGSKPPNALPSNSRPISPGHNAPGHSAPGHSASGHSASGHSASGHSASGHSASDNSSSSTSLPSTAEPPQPKPPKKLKSRSTTAKGKERGGSNDRKTESLKETVDYIPRWKSESSGERPAEESANKKRESQRAKSKRRTEKTKRPSRKKKSATLVQQPVSASELQLGVDGQLPELVVEAIQSKEEIDVPKKESNSMSMVVVLCVSVGLSLAMLFIDPTNTSTSQGQTRSEILLELEEYYIGTGPEMDDYQKLLRRAIQAEHEKDREKANAYYRHVLNLLHAERTNQRFGLTGPVTARVPPNDKHLETQLSELLRIP